MVLNRPDTFVVISEGARPQPVGVERKLQSVRNADFLIYTVAMRLYSLLADVKLLGDFFVSVPKADKAYYLSFPFGKVYALFLVVYAA